MSDETETESPAPSIGVHEQLVALKHLTLLCSHVESGLCGDCLHKTIESLDWLIANTDIRYRK